MNYIAINNENIVVEIKELSGATDAPNHIQIDDIPNNAIGKVYNNGVFSDAPIVVLTAEENKEKIRSSLYAMLPKKVSASKKHIIGKQGMTDDELEIQLTVYKKKADDARDGLDVFAMQAGLIGITQAEYRALVLQKESEFMHSEKIVTDRIEAVRQVLEMRIEGISNAEDAQVVESLMQTVDSFAIDTSTEEILNILTNTGE